MMKKIFWTFLFLVSLFLIGTYVYLKNTAPDYSGIVNKLTVTDNVDVYFDTYGIPHIYAQSGVDAYKALGYVHAQDRLFQMEMIRRLSSGRLAEILGKDLIPSDTYFRTLGLRRMAVENAKLASKRLNSETRSLVNAYLEGINAYIKKGKTPIEYEIIGIPKELFTLEDIYTALGYMGLGFTSAISNDPMFDQIYQKLGKEYLADLNIDREFQMKDQLDTTKDLSSTIIQTTEEHLSYIDLPIWYGSNGWVVSPEKSKSGQVIFANDTHIGISQPSVWYEAHLDYPGFESYGNYLAGVPFAVVGHNRNYACGLTIYPFDVLDLYRERSNPDNINQVWVDDHWEDVEIQKEVIKVKGQGDVVIERRVTRHGPIFNNVSPLLKDTESEPVSVWWTFLQYPTKSLEALYQMNYSKTMAEVRSAVGKIDFLGLNVLYGDKEGNIAHWGAGKIPIRPDHVNGKQILDGASGKDEILGYYPFSKNPKFENPKHGFVASANNDMGVFEGNYFEGYYATDSRISRIREQLSTKDKWSQEEMKNLHLDEISENHRDIAHLFAHLLRSDSSIGDKETLSILANWDGGYKMNQVAPTIFTKLQYHAIRLAMADELGLNVFKGVNKTSEIKSSVLQLLKNNSSPWWDDVSTKDKRESRIDIIKSAWKLTVSEIKNQLGADVNNWEWGKVHTIEHVHPIGRKKPLNHFFNVGPFALAGGDDVPNKMMYTVDASGTYKTTSSPALRVLIDFADVENSESINPTGQSGNPMSPHYNDQAQMFINGTYRKQLMNKKEIADQSRILTFEAK